MTEASEREMTISDRVTVVSGALPAGYRARLFRDEDREPLVAERNASLPEVEHQSATEWRYWERTAPDDTRVRLIVEAADGAIAASYEVGNGGPFRAPDGSARGNVRVARAHRRTGIGTTLLRCIETEARRLGAPTLRGQVSARDEDALPWATGRGFAEVGRRIEAAIDLDAFDPLRWEERARRPKEQGIRFATLVELREESGPERFEELLREMYAVETEVWADIPVPSPVGHWSYDLFRRILLEHPGSASDLDMIAFDGERAVAMTTSYRSEGGKRGGTGFTGTLRAYRGRGIAFTLKTEALARAKASGIRWMLTTNDEPNKAMRGINYTLGYEPLPATIQLEKKL
jgi:GNAT superfamily N-acetyltransferase